MPQKRHIDQTHPVPHGKRRRINLYLHKPHEPIDTRRPLDKTSCHNQQQHRNQTISKRHQLSSRTRPTSEVPQPTAITPPPATNTPRPAPHRLSAITPTATAHIYPSSNASNGTSSNTHSHGHSAPNQSNVLSAGSPQQQRRPVTRCPTLQSIRGSVQRFLR